MEWAWGEGLEGASAAGLEQSSEVWKAPALVVSWAVKWVPALDWAWGEGSAGASAAGSGRDSAPLMAPEWESRSATDSELALAAAKGLASERCLGHSLAGNWGLRSGEVLRLLEPMRATEKGSMGPAWALRWAAGSGPELAWVRGQGWEGSSAAESARGSAPVKAPE